MCLRRVQKQCVCIAAIDGAKRLGTKNIVFESDSSSLVQALQRNEYDRSAIGDLVKTAKRKFVTSFDSFQFFFLPSGM
jgi:ribonuclease HI